MVYCVFFSDLPDVIFYIFLTILNRYTLKRGVNVLKVFSFDVTLHSNLHEVLFKKTVGPGL